METAYFGRGLVITETNGILSAEWHKTNCNMKVGKFNDAGEIVLVECENGQELNGERTLDELYADGYKDVCEVAQPSEMATCSYDEYDTCFVQVWSEQEQVDEDELTAEEALQIITEGE